jgi:hypothetical protein
VEYEAEYLKRKSRWETLDLVEEDAPCRPRGMPEGAWERAGQRRVEGRGLSRAKKEAQRLWLQVSETHDFPFGVAKWGRDLWE